ncbi:hypothetical protein [Actinomycetospora corticicola]|uniref:Uncharacterized protein n=1 Tax=Actinomycetospora corticicola TaxID=663602 RepID=A0A7Y9DWL6_9PSEU|nr:hypothetical protein [Actinomycetospora corticicola]NYD36845.1 hypothetical protein [Actinomycetospora corticicola]
MAGTDERSGAARIAAKAQAAAAYQAHLAEQCAAQWRVALVGDRWRVAVRRPGERWAVYAVDPVAGRSDRGDPKERQRMGAWVREKVIEVEGIVLDLDYDAERQGRVAYTVEITR